MPRKISASSWSLAELCGTCGTGQGPLGFAASSWWPPGSPGDQSHRWLLWYFPLILGYIFLLAKELSLVSPFSVVNVKSYAGYITVNKTYNSNLFFWFFPAQVSQSRPPTRMLPGAPQLQGAWRVGLSSISELVTNSECVSPWISTGWHFSPCIQCMTVPPGSWPIHRCTHLSFFALTIFKFLSSDCFEILSFVNRSYHVNATAC